jgi:hypothetical protein
MAVAEFHTEAAFYDQKHFVFVFVVMEDELALELIELYALAVQLGGDVGLPVFGNFGEFVGDVDLMRHIVPPVVCRSLLQGEQIRFVSKGSQNTSKRKNAASV